MNLGDSVQDAIRPRADDLTTQGADDAYQTPSLRMHKPLQDIQDLIDKLAAVTQQLRHPVRSSDSAPRPLR